MKQNKNNRTMNKKNFNVVIPVIDPVNGTRSGITVTVKSGKAMVPQEVFNMMKMCVKSPIEEQFNFQLVPDYKTNS